MTAYTSFYSMVTAGALPGNKVTKGRNSLPTSLKLRICGAALQLLHRYLWRFVYGHWQL